MDSNREKLLSYVPMANFIAEMNGPRAEALIHDISDYEHSIIYITPRNITGRKAGGQLTDYAIRLVSGKSYEQADFVVNYLGRFAPENLVLRSSTYFIKNNGELIGLLCINIDITEQIAASETIRKALLVDVVHPDESQAAETFSLSSDELINKVVARRVGHLDGRQMTLAEKRAVVAELAALDVFMVKGTIPTVASLLNVSEQTIYRYINQTKAKSD